MAQHVLAQFQEHPDAWQRVPMILEGSSNSQAKYIGLQILEKLIMTRWKVIPDDQRAGIRNFIVGLTIKLASDETMLRRERAYLGKLNLILVQILKQEWPHAWPTFIPEIVASSQTNVSLCENNMVILKLLSEEIFDYSAEQMTTAKIKNLKNQMCGEFSDIFRLCSEVLDKAQKPTLIKATLECFLRFLNWIPLGYIFETNIIDTLLTRFLETNEFRNITLKCLSEIAGFQVGTEYDFKFQVLFSMVMTSINRMIPPQTDIKQAYATSSDTGQELVLNLALFLTNFLINHGRLIEPEQHRDLLLNCHLYMIKISAVEDKEIFKICLEYWSKLVAELYEEIQNLAIGENAILMRLHLGGPSASSMLSGYELRKNIYTDVLSNLRLVVIDRMAKPEEVLIVENDEGEIVREVLKESETIVMYKQMRELLVYLTHLDVADTESILTEKLAKQIDGSEWSWNNLNTLCWAIGSISGAMNEETEKRFLVTVIKELLGLVEMKRGKDNKAVVASNIMYIVGQYPRFLKAHWKFLKTVVNKLFEFMHETHEGVQDMACDTFIKITQKCRRHFVMLQAQESEPFIDEILRKLPAITVDLSPQQIHTFYEAVGYMISAQPNKPVQEKLIQKLMELPNSAWDALMLQASSNVDVLSNPDNVKVLNNVIKTNVAACLIATKTPKIRGLRTIKKEILKLMETYIKKAEEAESVNSSFIPQLLDAILGDYNRNVPQARDAEVLNVMATITMRLGPLLTSQVPPILDAVFEPTLNMINQDFTEYPEHRVGLYRLIRAINAQCFPALLTLPPAQFKLLFDSIIWGMKHTLRDIADVGLMILYEMVDNFAKSDPNVANAFFQQYFTALLQDLFFVLTDSDHKSGLKMQSQLLMRLFQLIESSTLQSPIFDPSTVPDPSMSNQAFLREFSSSLLKNAFPHLPPKRVDIFVVALCDSCTDANRFKTTVRDFLIQLKEFEGDNAELYLEEKELAASAKEASEREAAMRVPGMLKPSQIDDEEL
ncbi:Karyopherin transporter [Serendipita sp. 399]|nr:Karyopherin transporter [Serendipita sp. 399]